MSATLLAESPLQHQVINAIRNSPHTTRCRVRCETADGQVILRGVVGSWYQKQMAQEAVKGLPGIERIDNQLEVHWN
jgi:osmotically-inducible protein OsmY